MPAKNGALTLKEKNFLVAFAKHGDRRKAEQAAAIAAGGGYQILARPEIQKRIVAEQTARLTYDALPLAVETLVSVMRSDKAPAAARVQASKIVLDRALPTDGTGNHKELHEMTPDELAAAIATLEGQAAAMARPVNEPDQGGVFD